MILLHQTDFKKKNNKKKIIKNKIYKNNKKKIIKNKIYKNK